MRKYIPPKCGYTICDNVIETDGEVRGKVSGTMVGAIMGCSPFQTPFRVACDILGLCREDISDKPAVKAGQVLEARIGEYLGDRYPELGLFMPAEKLFDKRQGDHSEWSSDFDDEYFSGHLDGMVLSENGTSSVLEIKTTANYASWSEGVPEYYWWQVALYNRFTVNRDEAYIAVALLDQETQAHPERWSPTDDNVILHRIVFDHDKVERALERIRSWYDIYIRNNKTPAYDPKDPRDSEMYAHLLSLVDSEDAIGALLDKYNQKSLEVQLKMAELKDDNDMLDEMKAKIKSWMDVHGVDTVTSSDGSCVATLTTTYKKNIDPELMRAAGIDPEPFTVEKASKTFRLKQN